MHLSHSSHYCLPLRNDQNVSWLFSEPWPPSSHQIIMLGLLWNASVWMFLSWGCWFQNSECWSPIVLSTSHAFWQEKLWNWPPFCNGDCIEHLLECQKLWQILTNENNMKKSWQIKLGHTHPARSSPNVVTEDNSLVGCVGVGAPI